MFTSAILGLAVAFVILATDELVPRYSLRRRVRFVREECPRNKWDAPGRRRHVLSSVKVRRWPACTRCTCVECGKSKLFVWTVFHGE